MLHKHCVVKQKGSLRAAFFMGIGSESRGWLQPRISGPLGPRFRGDDGGFGKDFRRPRESGDPGAGDSISSHTGPYQTNVNFTSIFPRVALEYGQTICALATRSSATLRSASGRVIFSSTSMANPVGTAPMPTSPSIHTSSRRAIF